MNDVKLVLELKLAYVWRYDDEYGYIWSPPTTSIIEQS